MINWREHFEAYTCAEDDTQDLEIYPENGVMVFDIHDCDNEKRSVERTLCVSLSTKDVKRLIGQLQKYNKEAGNE